MIRWLFLLATISCFTAEMKTVCLNMIVKNESGIIRQCLASVKQVIDYWIIVDTGSTDGTQQIIQDFMKGVPGELHERPWVDFSHNRNQALTLSKGKGDYILFLDADEKLVFSTPLKKEKLDKDFYYVWVHQDVEKGSYQESVDYKRVSLIKNKLPWKWQGVIHEELICPTAKTSEILTDFVTHSDTTQGNRYKDPQKYLKDAAILEKALAKEPNHCRYQFYLAQSYANAKEYELALKHYKKRGAMGGDPEEIFYSKYTIAKIEQLLKKDPEIFIESYWSAHRFRPCRDEPLFCLACYYIDAKDYAKAYEILKSARFAIGPNEKLFVEKWIYEWGLQFKLVECCLQLGKEAELRAAMQAMLVTPTLPPKIRTVIEKGLQGR